MLRLETIDPRTLALLKDLMSLDILKDYHLVGGTALALQYGHRISVDLDLFGKSDIDLELLVATLSQLGEVNLTNKNKPIYQMYLNDIKIDIVQYPYDPIEPISVIDEIRLASPKDIAAMKITAIGTRTTKRDFYDLYFLLEHYQLSEIINYCELKFPDKDMFHYVRSIIYFDEVEKDTEVPKMLKEVSWQQVKDRIYREAKKLQL